MRYIHAILDAILPKRPICIPVEPDPLCVPGKSFRQAAYVSRLWRQS